MSVIIRRAGRRDLDAIQRLWLELRELETKADARLAISHNAAQIMREHREVILADPRSGLFVAEDGPEVIGYLHAQTEANDLVREPAKRGRIVDLIVQEGRRREGTGTRLLDYAKEWLASQGLSAYHVSLPAALPDAQRFFERAGLQILELTQRGEL